VRLPYDRFKLSSLNLDEASLREAILERRQVIRMHRDQKGDDRCWLDDWLVWMMLDDTSPEPRLPPSVSMTRCQMFYQCRRADAPDPMPANAISDPTLWDSDLNGATLIRLSDELACLQACIRLHRDIGNRPHTIDDDRFLYHVLPEKMPADFRLPPRAEFLGELRAPHAGCPSFWRSHQACAPDACNLHQWGPCAA
jgi:hypothetical protein